MSDYAYLWQAVSIIQDLVDELEDDIEKLDYELTEIKYDQQVAIELEKKEDLLSEVEDAMNLLSDIANDKYWFL